MGNSSVSAIEKFRNLARQARQYNLKVAMEGEEGLVIKGSLVVDMVRIIRANKKKDWDKYLVPQDWQIINGSCVISDWYPIGSFRRMVQAVFKEIAGSNAEAVRAFGRESLDYFLAAYENMIVDGDPLGSLKKLIKARNLFLKGNIKFGIVKMTPNSLTGYLYRTPEMPEKEFFKVFCYGIAGVAEGIISRSGGRNAVSLIEEDDEGCRISLTWEYPA